MTENPFDLFAQSVSEDLPVLPAESRFDNQETTTYGQLVNEIQSFRFPIYPYYDDYLNIRSEAPIEEERPWEFVSQDSKALASGAEFEVFPGQLFQNFDSLESSSQARQSNNGYTDDDRSYGDFKFIKPSSGASASSVSRLTVGSPPRQVSVALKVSIHSMQKTHNRPVVLGSFLKEIRVMGQLKSKPTIVDLLGVAFIEQVDPVKQTAEVRPTLVVELALGNTFDFFRSPLLANSINWTLKSQFCLNIADALQAIQSINLIHADIKGKNVLIFPDEKVGYVAKLSDFGSCVTMGSGPPRAPGTREYLPPECLGPDQSAQPWFGNSHYRDLYALGLFAWELATDCKYDAPFKDLVPETEIISLKSDGNGAASRHLLARVPEGTPQHFRDLISGTVTSTPTQRNSLEQIIASLQSSLEHSASPTLPDDPSPSDTTDTIDAGNDVSETVQDPVVKIPWSLQKRLFEESEDPSKQNTDFSSVMDSKVYLAYCYIICSDSHPFRDQALEHIRRAALKNPFHLVQGSRLTPFAVMLQFHDWKGLSELLVDEPRMDGGRLSQSSEQFLGHIYSFGWRKLLMLACKAGSVNPEGSLSLRSLRDVSEVVAISVIKFLTTDGRTKISQTPPDYDGFTALHWASLSGKPGLVGMLLDAGFDVDSRDKRDRTALHLCCQARLVSDTLSLDVSRKLVEHRPDVVNAVMKEKLYTPLRFAVDVQKPRLCRYLVLNGADVNAKAEHGSTPLQECAWVTGFRGNGKRGDGSKDESKALEIARILLTLGEVNIDEHSCHNSVTALGIAVTHGNFTEMVSLLLDHGANPNTTVDSSPAVASAVYLKNPHMLSLLLDHGADPNFGGPKDIYPLGSAVANGSYELASMLVDRGAKLDVLYRGELLVFLAINAVASTETDEVTPTLKLLLHGGAPVTMPEGGMCKFSPTHHAAAFNKLNILRALLDHKASIVEVEPEYGQTILHTVVNAKVFIDNPDAACVMIDFLIDNGAELGATDSKGETALHYACHYRQESMIAYLLAKGINRKAKAIDGRTARDIYLEGNWWCKDQNKPVLESTLASLES